MRPPSGVLEQARVEGGLSHADLWLRYFALGGMGSVVEVEAYLEDLLTPTSHERDLLATALDERISEVGRGRPVPYADEDSEGGRRT